MQLSDKKTRDFSRKLDNLLEVQQTLCRKSDNAAEKYQLLTEKANEIDSKIDGMRTKIDKVIEEEDDEDSISNILKNAKQDRPLMESEERHCLSKIR